MSNFHVIVVGSRTAKGSNNRYLPMPKENTEFIESVLGKVSSNRTDEDHYEVIYHGAAGNGIDEVTDNYAFAAGVKVKQFPAYWFDPTKESNVNKAAGIFRNEAMIRQASDDTHGKDDHQVILLAFCNTDTVEADPGLNHVLQYATKKGITCRTFALPVKAGVTPEPATAGTSNTVMPDPFGA